MELVQAKYKAMSFPGNEDSFERHSYEMPLAQKSMSFAYHAYGRRRDVDSVDNYNSGTSVGDSGVADVGRQKNTGVVSRRTQEKVLIDELLTLSSILKETPNRLLKDSIMWDAVPKVTTQLKGKDDVLDSDAEARALNQEESDIGLYRY